MSVNRYIESNKGTPQELELIASRGQRTFVGTQAAVEAAIKDGDIGEQSVVYITDDYKDKGYNSEIKVGGTYTFVKANKSDNDAQYLPDYGEWEFLRNADVPDQKIIKTYYRKA